MRLELRRECKEDDVNTWEKARLGLAYWVVKEITSSFEAPCTLEGGSERGPWRVTGLA